MCRAASVTIVSGERSRNKRVRIAGLPPGQLAARLSARPRSAVPPVMHRADVVLVHARELITCAGPAPRRGSAQSRYRPGAGRRAGDARRTNRLCRSVRGTRRARHAAVRRRRSSTSAITRSSLASSTRIRTRCSRAIAAASSAAALPARPTRRSRPPAAASSRPCARRGPQTSRARRRHAATPRRDAAPPGRRPARSRAATVSTPRRS